MTGVPGIRRRRIRITAGLLVLLVISAPGLPDGMASADAAEARSFESIAVSFSRLLTELSEKLVVISTDLTEDAEVKRIEHLLIFSELLLIKTIVNYETQLIHSIHFMSPDRLPAFYLARTRGLRNSKQQVALSLRRIRRHTAGLLSAMQSDRSPAGELAVITDLNATVERIIMLFDMSIAWFQRAAGPSWGAQPVTAP